MELKLKHFNFIENEKKDESFYQFRNYKFKIKTIYILNYQDVTFPLLIPLKILPENKKFELDNFRELIFYSIDEMSMKIKKKLKVGNTKISFSYFKDDFQILKSDKDFYSYTSKIIYCKITEGIDKDEMKLFFNKQKFLPVLKRTKINTMTFIDILEDDKRQNVNIITDKNLNSSNKIKINSEITKLDEIKIKNNKSEFKVKILSEKILNFKDSDRAYCKTEINEPIIYQGVKSEPLVTNYTKNLKRRLEEKKFSKIKFFSQSEFNKKFITSIDIENKEKNNRELLRKRLMKKLEIKEKYKLPSVRIKNSAKFSDINIREIFHTEPTKEIKRTILTIKRENKLYDNDNDNDFDLNKLQFEIIELIKSILKNENLLCKHNNILTNLLVSNAEFELDSLLTSTLQEEFLLYCFLNKRIQNNLKFLNNFDEDNFSFSHNNNSIIFNYFIVVKNELVNLEKNKKDFLNFIKNTNDSSQLVIDTFFFLLFIVPKKITERNLEILKFLIKIFEDKNRKDMINYNGFIQFIMLFINSKSEDKLIFIKTIMRTILSENNLLLVDIKQILSIDEEMISYILLVDMEKFHTMNNKFIEKINDIFEIILNYLR